MRGKLAKTFRKIARDYMTSDADFEENKYVVNKRNGNVRLGECSRYVYREMKKEYKKS